MKLASLKKGGRDGTLIVVDRDLTSFAEVGDIAVTMQAALDDWQAMSPLLADVYERLCAGDLAGSQPLDVDELASPLPRAYQFVDGSAYLAHVERVRRARGAEMPPSFLDDPLMYQAVSDGFLAPREDVVVASEESGIDFESEVIIVTDDVPMGVAEQDALGHIQLIGLVHQCRHYSPMHTIGYAPVIWPAASRWMSTSWLRRCHAPTSLSMAALISLMLNASGGPVAPKCRPAFSMTH